MGSDEEIAFFFGVSVQTIVNRRKQPKFAAAMRRGRAMACFRVRRAQMRLLDEGNATMAVRLGKSLLGQRETSSMRMVLPKNSMLAVSDTPICVKCAEASPEELTMHLVLLVVAY